LSPVAIERMIRRSAADSRTMSRDVRQALRSLAKRPSSAVLTIVVFALAIGANATVFSVFNGFLLRPLPFPDDDRLVMIADSLPKLGVEDGGVSIPGYLDWRERATALENVAIFAPTTRALRGDRLPEQLELTRASPSLFAVLAVAPALGRGFADADAAPGAAPVTVLSHRLWVTHFGARADVIGQDVQLDDELVRVVGVMPEGFGFPNRDVDAWVPFAYTAAQAADEQRFRGFARAVGRLRRDATLAGLSSELAAIARANVERLPQIAQFAEVSGYTVRARSLREYSVGDLGERLLVLQGLVLAVLLIACANVANLELSRLIGRRKELAVRAAMGAGVRRLARLVVLESVVLALAGAVAGMGLAHAGLRLVRVLGLERASEGFEFRLDATVIVVTLAAALLSALVAALVPVLALRGEDLARAVQESGRSSGGASSTRRWRDGLVVVQVAMSVALLVGAGLLARGFFELERRGPGFEPTDVWSAAVALPTARYADDAAQARFVELALAELAALPGEPAVGFTTALPFSGHNDGATIVIDGYEPAPSGPPPASQLRSIDAGYFRALSIPVVMGRNFAAVETERVAIVDATFARAYWPNEVALGQRVRAGTDGADEWYTVVGVVTHVKHERFGPEEMEPTLYWHYAQRPASAGGFVARTRSEGFSTSARAAVARLDPGVALYDIVPMDARVLRALGPERASMVLTLAFSVIALALAVIGVYGVVASAVARRVGEIGVRMALGARRADVVRAVVMGSARAIAAGVAVGTIAALALGRALAARVPEVEALDAAVLAGAALTLAVAALVASWVPARRAARVDPIEALRRG
jgi:predicted permease